MDKKQAEEWLNARGFNPTSGFTRTEVETLRAQISDLQEALYLAAGEVVMLQSENCILKHKLHRRWNGQHGKFQCPVCRRWVRLLEAELAMNDEILYVVGECKQHGRVTPTGRWTVEDIKAALPKGAK